MKTKELPAMKRETLLRIMGASREELITLIPALFLSGGVKEGWVKAAEKFLAFIQDGKPRFSIFVKGNGKLPFWAFSALPLVTCPGAGACKVWCYSLRAFRYPDAFFRQLQNTLMLRSEKGRSLVAEAWDILPAGTVRLYVDGDIESAPILEYWQRLCAHRPDLRVYGYSKSWELFLAYTGEFAPNYTLNLSGGSRYGAAMRDRMKALPCVRGEFLAFKAAVKAPKRDAKTGEVESPETWAAYQKAVRESAAAQGYAKVFVCPGLCGFCANGNHACGSRRFDGIPIAIGIH